VYSTQTQWIGLAMQLGIDDVGNSAAFSASSRPSQRTMTAAAVGHSSDVQWLANTWYQLDDIATALQQIVNRPDWAPGNSLAVLIRGTSAGAYSRKFVWSFEQGGAFAPRLVVTYSGTAN
jgi:hypothetical protein